MAYLNAVNAIQTRKDRGHVREVVGRPARGRKGGTVLGDVSWHRDDASSPGGPKKEQNGSCHLFLLHPNRSLTTALEWCGERTLACYVGGFVCHAPSRLRWLVGDALRGGMRAMIPVKS